MPLSSPTEREPLHRRSIDLRGYRRADGLFDVEAHLTDTKALPFNTHDRGTIPPGEPLHDMWLRLTVDRDLLITACEASTDASPYRMCPEVTPNYARLAGVRIGAGFRRAVAERLGGAEGCTHLRELLAQMATVAFQTLAGERRAAAAEDPEARARQRRSMLNSCYAYAPDSPVSLRRWPELAEAAAQGAAEGSSSREN
ncbi:DUF2889 domain-containing protein [Roseomonas elaeocarpi]|uniref:DUF2889 domain-containing protein n=1 Tax=Roseomonas elaeocarpi TaxID=907779 RepID=A0ABV6JSV5_9PROT